MKIKVKALDSFVHGRFNVGPGQEFEIGKGEADDLEKNGLVQLVGEPEAEEHDDLLGDGKAASAHENKMLDAPANKTRATRK